MRFGVSDGAPFHRKVVRAGNEAFGAWCRAGAWSGHPENLTDGLIPPEIAAALAPPEIWAKLRLVGLTDPPADGQAGEQIHGYLEHNPSAEKVRALRKAWVDRQRRHRDEDPELSRRDTQRDTTRDSRDLSRGLSRGSISMGPDPDLPPPIVPPLPGGAPSLGQTSGPPQHPPATSGPPAQTTLPLGDATGKRKPRRKPKGSMPLGWRPPADIYDVGADVGLDRRRVDAEMKRFADHHEAHGSQFADWNAAARKWIRGVPSFDKNLAPTPDATDRPVPKGEELPPPTVSKEHSDAVAAKLLENLNRKRPTGAKS